METGVEKRCDEKRALLRCGHEYFNTGDELKIRTAMS